MNHEAVRGLLHLVLRPGQPPEALPFGSLQELLDLCARHEGSAAFVRVEVLGSSAGQSRRLVLDFGQFSAWPV
jgi:hypothetical protein